MGHPAYGRVGGEPKRSRSKGLITFIAPSRHSALGLGLNWWAYLPLSCRKIIKISSRGPSNLSPSNHSARNCHACKPRGLIRHAYA